MVVSYGKREKLMSRKISFDSVCASMGRENLPPETHLAAASHKVEHCIDFLLHRDLATGAQAAMIYVARTLYS